MLNKSLILIEFLRQSATFKSILLNQIKLKVA